MVEGVERQFEVRFDDWRNQSRGDFWTARLYNGLSLVCPVCPNINSLRSNEWFIVCGYISLIMFVLWNQSHTKQKNAMARTY